MNLDYYPYWLSASDSTAPMWRTTSTPVFAPARRPYAVIPASRERRMYGVAIQERRLLR